MIQNVVGSNIFYDSTNIPNCLTNFTAGQKCALQLV